MNAFTWKIKNTDKKPSPDHTQGAIQQPERSGNLRIGPNILNFFATYCSLQNRSFSEHTLVEASEEEPFGKTPYAYKALDTDREHKGYFAIH
ncbi:hypothetical protein AA3271_1714 [Gluconobacter japonicus NBRC 3271]|nr:hypothetical protein AA3271_1714 [Gluconobacter japonicus NBRC 3271]